MPSFVHPQALREAVEALDLNAHKVRIVIES